MIFTLGMTTAAFASEISSNTNGNIISHSETWVTPFKYVEVTVYDLGDGFTATEMVTDDISLLRASGTKSQKATTEIKNGSTVAATLTVSGTFSYDGKSAKITDYSSSRSVKSGYAEDSWSTTKRDSSFLYGDARVHSILTVKKNGSSKTYVAFVQVTCGKNG